MRVTLWQAAASCLAVAHMILGTLILASLVFVGFHDYLIILARLLTSALVSRAIILLQLDVIRDQVSLALPGERLERDCEDSLLLDDPALGLGGMERRDIKISPRINADSKALGTPAASTDSEDGEERNKQE